MDRKLVCKHCGNTLVWDGFAGMGSSHSNWYVCDNEECERYNKPIVVYDEDLQCKDLRV
jgi:hypothetical protein